MSSQVPMDDNAIAHVVVVEDDPSIMVVVQTLLEEAGYSVATASDGQTGLSLALDRPCDLIILDLNLPKLSGLDVCRQAKVIKPQIPIIMLTARSEDSDIISGLEIGADDYLTKPFNPRELLARVRARLRSVASPSSMGIVNDTTPEAPVVAGVFSQVISCADMVIDGPRMVVTRKGVEVALTSREFEVLYLLARNPGRVISRDSLLKEVWGTLAESYRMNVSIMMSRLRKKVEDDPENPRFILTVRGVGYKFTENS